MLKSEYIQKEHENTLLLNGYICAGEENGIQTWIDLAEQGQDIHHLAYQYPTYADELDLLSPSDAAQAGAVYFIVGHPNYDSHKGTVVAKAIAFSRRGIPL